jgi:hypothetical protein
MRNIVKISIFSCVLLGLTTACNKESVDTPVTPIDTEMVKNQLGRSLKNWNDHLATVATFKSYKEVEEISTEAQLTTIIDELTAPSAIAAYGDVLDAQTIRLDQLSNLLPNEEALTLLKTEIQKQIHVGDKIMEITWAKGEQPFTTKCIVNKTGIVWDNILYGVYIGQSPIEATSTERINTNSAAKKYDWSQSVYWVWGDKRGQMDYSMYISYNPTNSIVTSTVVETHSSMNSGTSFHKNTIIFDQGTHGMAKIALGLATPMTALKFNENDFAVTGSATNVFNIRKTLYPK